MTLFLRKSPLYELNAHEGAVTSVKFAPSGEYMWSTGGDRCIRLWNCSRGDIISEFKGPHNNEIHDVVSSRDNTKFVSVGADKIAFLWDLNTSMVTRKLTGHTGSIFCAEFNFSDEVLITGSYDRTVRLWDMRSNSRSPLQVMELFSDSALCCTTQYMEHEFVVGSVDGSIATVDMRMGLVHKDDLQAPVTAVCVSPNGKVIAAATLASPLCPSGSIYLLDRLNGERLHRFEGHKCLNAKTGLAFSPSGDFLFVGGEDGMVTRYQVGDETSAPNRKLSVQKPGEESIVAPIVTSLRIHRTSGALLTGLDSGVVQLWNDLGRVEEDDSLPGDTSISGV